MELVYEAAAIGDTASALLKEMGNCRVVALEGPMGAGKTTIIQAICRRLGVQEAMSSPTFSIINEYLAGSSIIYHIDLYRCNSEEEAVRAGVEDCLYSGNLCFVEWPSVAKNIFPPQTITLSINQIDNTTRKITVNRTLYGQNIQ